MSETDSKDTPRRCINCGGERLLPGKLSTTQFMAEGKINWIGYYITVFGCMDCGFLGSYLGESDMDSLRKYYEKSFGG